MGNIKKLSLGLILLFPSCVWSEEVAQQIVGPFGTLNNADSPFIIPSDMAQDLLNVDLSPGGRSILKRKGYATAFTLGVSSAAVHGVYNFYDASGNEVALFFNDRYISASINGLAPTVLLGSGTINATYQCVDSLGYAYCLDSGHRELIKTNGANYSALNNVNSTGSIVAVTSDRLVQAGFLDEPSRIDFSRSADFGTWKPGSLATDPISFTIVAPGPKITHSVYAFNRTMWFKDSSFGYILDGPTHADWEVKTVSPNVGTLDNSSIYWQGILYFRGQDGHIYAFDGSNLQKLTRNIQGTISASQKRASNYWNQTTAADWNLGAFDYTTFVDTTTDTGLIQTTFPDHFSTFRNGQGGTTAVYSTASTNANIKIDTSGGQLVMTQTPTGDTGNTVVVFQQCLPSFAAGATYYMKITSMTVSGPSVNFNRFFFQLSTSVPNSTNRGTGSFWLTQFLSTDTTSVNFWNFNNSAGTSVNPLINIKYPFTLSFFIDQTNYQYTINGSSVLKRGTHSWTVSTSMYASFYLSHDATLAPTNWSTTIDDFSIVPQTFTFVSAVKNAPALSSWDTFSADTSLTGGSETFSLRAQNTIFTIDADVPAYSTIVNGAIPSIATGSYFQVRDYFATTSTNGISLSDFTQNWFEGLASDKAYATYHRDALWWAVTSGENATTNNRVLRYDLLNNGWLLYDIPMNGMYVRNQSLYFGSTTGGYIYKFGDVDNDNGSPINAYWKSKDFFADSPLVDKDFRNISVFGNSVQNSTMTLTYTIDALTSASFSVPLYKASRSLTRNTRNLPVGTNGTTINLKFGNNAADQPFEVYGAAIGYKSNSWNPGD